MNRDNRVKVGFFSFTRSSPDGDDRPYLTWHQLDHMPEQYQLPGMVLGQRWRSTPACRQARTAVGDWSSVEHLVCYLMGEPVDRTVDEFLSLGRELAEAGRYPVVMPSHYRGGLRLLQAQAAPRVLVSDAVVPFRPHRGVQVVVEELAPSTDGPGEADDRGAVPLSDELVRTLVGVPGVAGVWTFATAFDLRRSMFSEGRFRITLCYLDEEPADVSRRITEATGPSWADIGPSRVVLAAPYESVVRWDWEGVLEP